MTQRVPLADLFVICALADFIRNKSASSGHLTLVACRRWVSYEYNVELLLADLIGGKPFGAYVGDLQAPATTNSQFTK